MTWCREKHVTIYPKAAPGKQESVVTGASIVYESIGIQLVELF